MNGGEGAADAGWVARRGGTTGGLAGRDGRLEEVGLDGEKVDRFKCSFQSRVIGLMRDYIWRETRRKISWIIFFFNVFFYTQ